MSADLQYDLHTAEAAASSSQTADDPKKTREVVARIEEACGLQNINQIVEKAERHQDTSATLTEMRKTLQTKVLQLLQKRDALAR